VTPLVSRLVIALTILAALGRFVALERSPPAFWIDEAAGATHALCLAETGHDAAGRAHPLFSPALGGGLSTAPYLYSAALMTRLLGPSIGTLRAVSALYSALTILCVGLVASALLGRQTGWLAALAAAVSPWGFQFARISWDPPLAPALLMLGAWLYLRRPERPGTASDRAGVALSGAVLSLAMYAYPPARVQVPLVALVLVIYRRRPLGELAIGAAALVITSLPLVAGTLSGELHGRFNAYGIMAPHAMNPGGRAGPLRLAAIFAHNLLLHLRPDFVFARGDANLRHSSRFVGELGWLDDLALLGLIGWLGLGVARRRKKGSEGPPLAVLGLCAFGIFAGLTPAALTFDSLPHALRGIGAWPFVALGTGAILGWLAVQHRAVVPTALAIAAAFSVAFSVHYFGWYARVAGGWFEAPVVGTARALKGDPAALAARLRSYPALAARYYLMAFGGDTCAASAERLRR
jgi:hypothetical protein